MVKIITEPQDPAQECLFYATTDDACSLYHLFDFMGNTLPYIPLILSPTGVNVKKCDNDQVILVDANLPKKSFLRYYCTDTLYRSVPNYNIKEMLKNVKKKDSAAVWITKAEPMILYSRIYNVDKERNNGAFSPTCTFTQDIYQSLTDYQEPVNIPSNEFQRMCKDFAVYNQVEATYYPNGVLFTASNGQIIGKFFAFGAPYPDNTESETKVFSQNLFSKLAKLAPLSRRFFVSFQEKMPMRLETTINTLGEITVYLNTEKAR